MRRSYSVIYHQPAGHTFTDQDVQYVWIHASEYANIFGEKRKNGALGDYVSISYQEKKIYRKVETTGHLGVGKDSIALNYNSLAELGLLKDPNEDLGAEKLLQKVYVQPALINSTGTIQTEGYGSTIASLRLPYSSALSVSSSES